MRAPLAACLLMGALVLLPARPSAAEPAPVPPERVRAALVRMNWTPAAADWLAATATVTVDPSIRSGNHFGLTYARTANAPPRIVLLAEDDVFLEHEAHHVWNDEHGDDPAAVRRDLELLAADPILGALARAALAADDAHLNHRLTAALAFDPRPLPAWYRDRHVPYLLVRHRVLLPDVRR